MVFKIDDAGFDDRCVARMTFWQLCTLKNTPRHNALSSSAHTHRHDRKCRDFYASCRLFSLSLAATHVFGRACCYISLSLSLYLLFPHTHVQAVWRLQRLVSLTSAYHIKPLSRSPGELKTHQLEVRIVQWLRWFFLKRELKSFRGSNMRKRERESERLTHKQHFILNRSFFFCSDGYVLMPWYIRFWFIN